MRKTFSTILLSVLCLIARAQREDIIDQYKLKGKVVAVTTKSTNDAGRSESVSFKVGKVATVDNSEGIFSYTYNKDGLLISIDSDSDTDKKIVFKYDSKKRRISRTEPGGYVWSYEYRSDGKLIQEKVSVRTGLIPNVTCIDYQYSPDGSLKQKFITDSINYNTTLIEFNKSGNITRSAYAPIVGPSDFEWINTYDDDQRLVKAERKTAGVIDLFYTYKYELDEMRNWTRQTRYDSNGDVKDEIIREITYEE